MKEKNIKLKDFEKEIKERKEHRLITISAIDEGENFSLFYHFDTEKIETIKVVLPKEKPVIQSIMFIFPSAELYEREIHDFFDIEFEGNLNLHEKLFLPDDWKGKPPLRK